MYVKFVFFRFNFHTPQLYIGKRKQNISEQFCSFLLLFFHFFHLIHIRLPFFSSDRYFKFVIILTRNVAGNGYSHGLQHNLIPSDNWRLSLRSQTTRCHRVRVFACNAKTISQFWIQSILSETRSIILHAAKCEALHSVTQQHRQLSFQSKLCKVLISLATVTPACDLELRVSWPFIHKNSLILMSSLSSSSSSSSSSMD
jgi:hypothetical protein